MTDLTTILRASGLVRLGRKMNICMAKKKKAMTIIKTLTASNRTPRFAFSRALRGIKRLILSRDEGVKI